MTNYSNTNFAAFIFGSIFGSVITYFVMKNIYSNKKSIENEAVDTPEREQIRKEFIKEHYDIDKIITDSGYATNDTPCSEDNVYYISIEEYGELYDYGEVNLTLYTDGILTDEENEIIDDPEEFVGSDNLNDILDRSEYVGNSIFIRNDAKKCDYEITISGMSYREIAEERPDIVLHGEEEYE